MANTVQIILDVDDKGSAKVTKFSSTLTDQVKKASGSVAGLAEETGGAVAKTEASFTRLIAKIGGITIVLATVKSGVKATFEYLSQIETASLGIAAAFMTGGKYVDATTGKALEAQSALRAAQEDSKRLIQELQFANLQTIATLDQLIVAYQQTLPVAMAKGFNVAQVKEFTVAMVQAAGAIGLSMDQLAEETRSLLTGAINPRNSRIATVLGLRNEDIAEYQNNAAGLFDFLMGKLSAYKVAGIEAQTTWAGLWSNSKDLVLQYLGQGLEPLFAAVKYELQELTSKFVILDATTKSIKLNPEFVSGMQSLRDGVYTILAGFYRLGMLADKVGGSLTRFTFGATFGAVMPWGEGLAQRNEAWAKRYDDSNKALMDMAMRAAGWKPMTPEMNRQIQEAMKEGKKIADQTWQNIGGDGDGTPQLLRYFRTVEEKVKYEQTSPEDADQTAVRKSAVESLKKINKAYFKDQEENLKFLSEITKTSSVSNYLAEKDALDKRAALATEYYARTKAEISLEAEARTQEEKSKLSNAQYMADALKTLDAEQQTRSRDISRQQILLSIHTAEEDKKSLSSRLSDAQKFYDSLQGMIKKNQEAQKKGIEELNALYKQQADLQTSTAALLRGLDEISMTPTQKYASQKAALSDQYMAAMRQSGQEQVKSLEEYKQALASFGQAWAQGVTETTQSAFWGEQSKVVATGKEIIASVKSDIESAQNAQKRALEDLAEEKQKEIEANKLWGDTLVQTAKEWATEIDKLRGVIKELDTQIREMEKTIRIKGVDEVSPVVNSIAARLAELHDKTVYITTIQQTISDGYRSSGASVGAPLTLEDFKPAGLNLDRGWSPTPYAKGTDYVPRTGLVLAHEGEIIIPTDEAEQIRRGEYEARPYARPAALLPSPSITNSSSKVSDNRTVKIGDIIINLPEAAAPQRPEDWRTITRQYIVPELRKLGHA